MSETPPSPSLPFPESLCHRCAAPPRYVKTATSTFILCPLLPVKYPPQPVLRCALFQPRPGSGPGPGDDPTR
jgi:hypothetical protein